MSGNFSRYAHRKDELFSRVSLVQGAMITESDQREGQAAQARMSEGGDDMAIGSGVPRDGGILAYATVEGPPDIVSAEAVRPGRVMADGLWGEVRAVDDADLSGGPLMLLDQQAGYLAAGAVPASGRFLLFADIWDRHVGAAEDAALADPAFLGAETSVRLRRMAQLKLMDAGSFQGDDDRTAVQDSLPPYGDLRLVQAELTGDTPVEDPCDPCAASIEPGTESANALFRFEIHDSPFATLQREGAVAHPVPPPVGERRVVVKFSLDNGSVEVPGSAAQSLIDDPAFVDFVFEITDVAGEQALGVNTRPDVPRGAELVDLAGLDAAVTAGLDGRIVRVWDGAVSLDLNAPDLDPQPIGARTIVGTFTEEASLWRLEVNVLTLALVFEGARRGTGVPYILPGDVWAVAIREFADETGSQVGFVPEPVEVEHHYTFVGRIENADFVPQTALGDFRSQDFPALTALDAQSVEWSNHHHPDVETNTVQGALDLLWAREPVEGGGCLCTYCIDPDQGLDEQLAGIAEDLRQQPADEKLTSARICLPRGLYRLGNAAGFADLGHVILQGAGRDATEVVLADGAALELVQCDAIELSDLSIVSEDKSGNSVVTIQDCDRVDIARCLFGVGDAPQNFGSGEALVQVMLSSAEGAAAWISDNVFAIGQHRTALWLSGGDLHAVENNVMTGPGRPAFKGIINILPDILDKIAYGPAPAGVTPGAATGIYRVPGSDDQVLDLTGFPVSERNEVFKFIADSSELLVDGPLTSERGWGAYKSTVTVTGRALETRTPAESTTRPVRGRGDLIRRRQPVARRARNDTLAAPTAAASTGARVAVSPILIDILETPVVGRPEIGDIEVPTLSEAVWSDVAGVFDDFKANVKVSVYRRAFGMVLTVPQQARAEVRGNRFDWVHSAIVVQGSYQRSTNQMMPQVGQVEVSGNHILRIPVKGDTRAELQGQTYPAGITCTNAGSVTLRDNQVRHLVRDTGEADDYVAKYIEAKQVNGITDEGYAAISLRGIVGPVAQCIGNEASYFRHCVHVDGQPAWDRDEYGEFDPRFLASVWTFRRNTVLPALPLCAGVEIARLGTTPQNLGNVRIIPFRPTEVDTWDDNHPPMFVNR